MTHKVISQALRAAAEQGRTLYIVPTYNGLRIIANRNAVTAQHIICRPDGTHEFVPVLAQQS